jgi:hypothetical protein
MPSTSDVASLAIRYIEAAGAKQYETVATLLAPDVSFTGPFTTLRSADAFVAALRRLEPIWEHTVVRAAFANGDRACVTYDFQTNTEAGSLPCVEVLTIRDARIQSVELFFDPAQFAPARASLAQRAATT